MSNFPYVITVSSEKGGVGKTTLATNLAVFLKAMREDLPVAIFSFDNHFTIDKMFALKNTPSAGTVADFICGRTAAQLLQTGQYGVNFIPSSPSLTKEKGLIRGPMDIARLLAESDIPGILIIDTRPDLDILTENALYAADRVLIPVKDMPSLENCRNIFALFDKRGLDKKSLTLLPCLIDERIKFDGLFSDQKSLLRAFAINRGYRCHDIYISKSPKVESLNTNPDGKIYPVLTHGRGTDVHGQFSALAREILADYDRTDEPRAQLFKQWLTAESVRERETFAARLSGTRKDCLFCGRETLPSENGAVGYYFETSDNNEAGFLDSDCFLKFLSRSIFNLKGEINHEDPTLLLLQESARSSVFFFRMVGGSPRPQVEFKRLNTRGEILTSRELQFREHAGGMFHDDKCPLHTLMTQTIGGQSNDFRDAFLLIHPVNPAAPAEILQKEQYRQLHTFKAKLTTSLT